MVKPPEDKTATATATPEAAKPAPVAEKSPALASDDTQTKPTGGAGSVIQLGAFANRAQAGRAWNALSARFPNIAAMNGMIVPFPGGIRLRAGAPSAAEAKQACDALKPPPKIASSHNKRSRCRRLSTEWLVLS